MLIESLADSNR